MGGAPALVEWKGRYAGTLLWRPRAMAGGNGQATAFDYNLPDGRLHQPVSQLGHSQRGVAAFLQLRLGRGPAGIAHYAEHGNPHHKRWSSQPALRQGVAAFASDRHAGVVRPSCAVLYRLDSPPRL